VQRRAFEKHDPMKCYFFLLFFTVCVVGVSAQGVKIGTGSGDPDPAAMLEIESASAGFLPPRMNTQQRDAIAQPVPVGLCVYNTDEDCINYFNGVKWLKICGCSNPDTPTASASSAVGIVQFTANWLAASGAEEYRLDVSVSSDFTTFLPGYENRDVGVSLSHVITGLNANTTYYYRVRAINSCGTTPDSQIISTSTASPFSDVFAYWKLDGNANDELGGYHGTPFNISFSSGNGKIGSGAGMNGTSSYVNLGDYMNGMTSFSVSLWVRFAALTGNFQAVYIYRGTNDPWTGFYASNANKVYTGINASQLIGAATLSTNQWYHVVMTYDGVTLRSYLNGGLDASTTLNGAAVSFSGSPAIAAIGRKGNGAQDYVNGAMDEVGFWTRGLTADEVSYLYNGGAGRTYPD